MRCCCISVMWCGFAMTEASEALVVHVHESHSCRRLAALVILTSFPSADYEGCADF